MNARAHDFHNRLRILASIDADELEAAGIIARGDHNAWGTFRRDPFRYFIRADDETAAKLWTILERRSTRPTLALSDAVEKGDASCG